MYKKDKFLVELRFEKATYSVRATVHARERMDTRGVEELTVVGNVLALGEKRLHELHAEQEELLVTDDRTDTAIIVGFKKNTLHIVTVFDGTNMWNNRGTRMVRINLHGEIEE